MPNINMQKIADKAGISRFTVSRVLNNRAVPIKKETREKVLRIAEELNFRPNQLARSLRTGKTYNIGMICYGDNTKYFNDPYTGNIYEGVGRFLASTPYKLVFHCVMGDDPAQYLELMESRAVDGVIFHLFSKDIDFFKRHSLASLKKLGLPFVAVHSTTEHIGCASVGLDCVKGGYIATEHLLNHGYESVAHITPMIKKRFDSIHWQELRKGFEQAMIKGGKTINAGNIIYTETMNSEGGYCLADRLLSENRTLPRAFFVVDSVVAYGMLRKFRETGVRVPEDTAIIGFGNLNPEADTLVGLTTVSQPARDKGFRAAEMLHRLLEYPDKHISCNTDLLVPELIINRSCGC